MAIETGLEGKPWYYGALVGLLLAVGLLFAGNQFLVKSINTETDQLRTRLTELENKIEQGRSAQASLPRFREQVRRLELELDKLLRILPAKLNTQEILRNVRTLAEQGDFELKLFQPATTLSEREFYKEWPIQINMEGRYHNLAVFFDKIRRYPRIFNIENLRVQALDQPGGNDTLEASFTAKTFVYSEDETDMSTPAGQP